MKGRAVVLHEYRRPFTIEEFEVPDPAPGAVLLKMKQAGICGSDLHTWRGDRDQRLQPIPPTGQVMGHEGTGVIERLGPGVTTDWLGRSVCEGDRVMHWITTACFKCRQCNRGNTNLCTNPPGRYPAPADEWPFFGGTYADYFYVSPDRPFYLVPEELPDASLSWVNCAMGTSAEGLRQAQCGQGDYVVIQGAGGLGLCAATVATYRGAAKVIVLDRLPGRLALAERFGADHTINVDEYPSPEERRARILELTDGAGADVVMELVGMTELIPEGIGYLSPAGTLVAIGNVTPGRTFALDPLSIIRGQRVVGSSGYPHGLLPILMDLMVKTQHAVPYDQVISDQFTLEQVNEAMAAAEWSNRRTSVTRAVLKP
jgi:D-arabinose 1-dehydrogenase-like Zn-dependent alcohol dehydrogenase